MERTKKLKERTTEEQTKLILEYALTIFIGGLAIFGLVCFVYLLDNDFMWIAGGLFMAFVLSVILASFLFHEEICWKEVKK